MTGLRQSLSPLAAGLAVFLVIFSVSAQTSPVALKPRVSPINSLTLLMPPPPPPLLPPSPVALFRSLLAMSAPERASFLTNRPPEIRASILAKVREYQQLPPDERELRLQATELRWYVMLLLKSSPANRDAQLALLPDNMRSLVTSRLTQWDILPPPLQQEFLDNDRAMHYFSRLVPSDNSDSADPSAAQRQQIADQFNQFFALNPAEKRRALMTLSNAERAEMEKTLQAFGQLPVQQRLLCLRNYATFAGLSAADRADFLKNAERWSRMTPTERQTWRDLVANVPRWPPLPPSPVPSAIIPHAVPKSPRPSMATN